MLAALVNSFLLRLIPIGLALLALQKTLGEQKHLADLGLAVSKINHDMRNILASAQLMSDRLVDVERNQQFRGARYGCNVAALVCG